MKRPDKQPSPRPFAQGTGVLLQTVGMILFLSTCCICSGYGVAESGRPPDQVMEEFRDYQVSPIGFSEMLRGPGKAGVTLMVIFVTTGGLAMAVFGLGLQSEKRGAGWAAFITTAALTLVLIIAGAGLWVGGAGLLAKILNAALILVLATLTAFCYVALREVLANPPSGELNTVPADFDPKSIYHNDEPLTAERLAQMRQKLERERRRLEELEQQFRDEQDPGTP